MDEGKAKRIKNEIYYTRNRDKILAQAREHYKKIRKERLAVMQKYYNRNKKRLQKYSMKYYEMFKALINDRKRQEYRRKHER